MLLVYTLWLISARLLFEMGNGLAKCFDNFFYYISDAMETDEKPGSSPAGKSEVVSALNSFSFTVDTLIFFFNSLYDCLFFVER